MSPGLKTPTLSKQAAKDSASKLRNVENEMDGAQIIMGKDYLELTQGLIGLLKIALRQ